MTHMEVATRTVDGISLRQRLRSDLRRMDRGEEFFRMGKSYFENLQVAYVHNFEIAQMLPDHDGEHVPDELILALMEATRDHHPDDSRLLQYLKDVQATDLNSTCVVGVLRYAKKNKCDTRAKLMSALEVVRFVERCGLCVRYQQQTQHMFKWFDKVMVEVWLLVQEEHFGVNSFCIEYHEPLTVVIDEVLMLEILSAESWCDVRKQLEQVVAQSETGAVVFYKPYALAMEGYLEKNINQMCRGWVERAYMVKNLNIEQEQIDAWVRVLNLFVETEIDVARIRASRLCNLFYRDMYLPTPVTSIRDHLHLAAWAVAKTLAVENQMLQELHVERVVIADDALFPRRGEPVELRVEPALLANMRRARHEVNEMMRHSMHVDKTTGRAACDAVKTHETHLRGLDPSITLEMALLDTACGDKASGRLYAAVLRTLPGPMTPEKDFEESLTALKALADELVFFLAPEWAQRNALTGLKMVVALVHGDEPDFSEVREVGSFLSKVKDALQYYVSVDHPTQAGKLYGTEALKVMMTTLQAKVDARPLRYIVKDDLKPFATFRWLMDTATREGIDKIMEPSGGKRCFDIDHLPKVRFATNASPTDDAEMGDLEFL